MLGHEPWLWLAFSFPIWKGTLGLLVNPSKGLLIHSPWAAFGLAAIWTARRSAGPDARRLTMAMAVSAAPTFLLYAKLNGWFGGWCWGYRYLTDLLPECAILAALGMNRIWDLAALRRAAYAAVVISVLVQSVGALTYDGEWHRLFDLGIGPRQRWVWQLRDGQIPFYLRRGTVHLPWNTLQLWPNPYRTEGLLPTEHWPAGDFAWTGKEARFLFVASSAPARLTVQAPPDPAGTGAPFEVAIEDGAHRSQIELRPGASGTIPLGWIAFQHGSVLHLTVDRTYEEKPGGRRLGVALPESAIRRVE
jgi:hypothetical protein